jgi:hypothetical protein
MRFFYIDESGDTGPLPSPTTNVQPVVVIGGVVLESRTIHPLTLEFIERKQRFFPRLKPPGSLLLDWILAEVKGAELRRNVSLGTRREQHHAIGFLDKILELLEAYDARLIARVWIKGIAAPIDGNALYTSSIQAICTDFQQFLEQQKDCGIVIADSRSKQQNANVAHSIFTWKFKSAGDGYDRILEMPSFGHSDM